MDEHTDVGSVQQYGQRAKWPDNVVYVGMPGKAAQAFGIPFHEGRFGKPWNTLEHPLGWQTGYLRLLVLWLTVDEKFREDVRNLHGKTLVCWCVSKGSTHCHAFLLREFVELLWHEHD